MKKPMLFLALEVLLVAALLLLPGRCQGSQGANANLTVTGTVFCDACSSSSFSNHSYFLPGVKVRIDCAIRASSPSREEVKITAERTTDSHGAYRLDIPAVAGLGCTTGGEAASFCRAAVLHNPSPLCDVPALTTTARHISFSSAQDPGACLYNLNSLYYRPGKKAVRCDGAGASPAAALNTSLFYCPHWPWPPIPFCTPRPWFPPIPFLTPPPPAFPFPLPPFPPIPFFTPPCPPIPSPPSLARARQRSQKELVPNLQPPSHNPHPATIPTPAIPAPPSSRRRGSNEAFVGVSGCNLWSSGVINFNQTFLNMVSVNVGLVHYVLDHIYGTLLHRTKLGTPFFSKGWGGTKLDLLERMVKQLFPEAPCQSWPPTAVQPKWKTVWETKNSCLREGVFRTTCDERLIDALPPESHNARVAFLTPKDVSPEKMACVVHLAGTGDHSFERRLRLGGPLLKDNIATMVLESPYYGQRRPSMQHGAKLQCVSDLLLLGKATIDEARSLLYWLQAEAGYGKMGICGLSMGGVHAAMVGSLHPTPIATLPFLAPHSAVVPFCEGLYRHATAWEALREDAAALAKDATSLSEDAASGITIEQVKDRLRSVLSLTDVTRFPLPKNPQAVIFVGATDDGYIPRHSVMELQKAWPGSEVRWVMGGHVSSFLLHNDSFRKAIVDALDRL